MSINFDADRQPLRVKVGRTWLWPAEVGSLTVGSTVELDTRADEDIEVYLDRCLVARGHAVVVADTIGVRITEIVRSETPAACDCVTQT